MAAGLGFKDFVTGEVLTAADVDGYLMQGVWVFASATARDAAVTSPQEGNFAYLKDTNVTTYYTGSAWANLDTTGMTNPMTTTGDTIYSSSGSTPARLGIGTTGQVLTVAGGVPSWATPGGGSGLVKIATSTLSAASAATFNDVFSATYDNYRIVASFSATPTADLPYRFRVSGSDNTTSNYNYQIFEINGSSTFAGRTSSQTQGRIGTALGDESSFTADIFAPFLGIKKRIMSLSSRGSVGTPEAMLLWNTFNDTTSFTGISIYPTSSTFSGEITIYGYAK
jgi:hypothetical protein